MSGFVFDFDGPIFDGRKAARLALAETAKQFSDRFKLPIDLFERLPLFPPKSLIPLLCSELSMSPSEIEDVETHYRANLVKIEETMDMRADIKQLFRNLKDAGSKIAVLSSRRKEDLQRRLNQIGIGRLIDVAHGRDSLTYPKPHPAALTQIAEELQLEPRALVFLGDSDSDFQCARDAKVIYYHVAWSGEPSYEAARNAVVTFRTSTDLLQALGPRAASFAMMEDPALPHDLVEAIENGDLCFYAGSGVSVPSGIGDWNGHYGKVLQSLGAGYLVDDGVDMPELLQLLAARPGGAKQVFDYFQESFDKPDLDPNAYHFGLLRAQPGRIWTSNYDQLLEKANVACGFGYHVITSDKALLEHFRSRKLVIKMNGDFAAASYSDDLNWGLVFTQEQFDLVERERPEIWRLFEDDYRNRCILFLGVSFRDAALRRIVSIARQKIPRTRYNHYLLARASPDPVKRSKEELHASNLRRHYIETRFVGDFAAVRRFVAEVAITARRPIIGFSGSFRDLEKASEEEIKTSQLRLDDGSLTAAQVCQLGAALGKALAEHGYRVTSGCSPVVGIPPVSAAFDAEPTRARFYLRTRGGTKYSGTAPAIVIPPEPGEGAQDVYGPMRKRFVSELSLLIAYGGTVSHGGRRSGALDEIEAAMTRHIPVLIIPQVGGAVRAYRETYMQGIDRFYPDPGLAGEIRQLNELVSNISAEKLVAFARTDLPHRIHDLMMELMCCSLRVGMRESIATDW